MSHLTYHLVHANIAIARASLDDPVMAGFIAQVDEINSIAQTSPGFVGQPVLPDEGEVFTGRMLVNVSIWKSVEYLDSFTHHGRHAHALKQRAEWFEQSEAPNYVLFWVAAGNTPSERDVKQRIEHLRRYGPTSYAFTLDHPFNIDDMPSFGSAEAEKGTT